MCETAGCGVCASAERLASEVFECCGAPAGSGAGQAGGGNPASGKAGGGEVLPRRLRRSAAAVLVLAAGGCRERAGGGRAGRFLAGADRALRRLGAEISAAEAGGLLTPERALRLLELQVSTGLVLAARCRTADVAPPRACRTSA